MELVAFLAERPTASVSLVHCTGMHSALVQVLLAWRDQPCGAQGRER